MKRNEGGDGSGGGGRGGGGGNDYFWSNTVIRVKRNIVYAFFYLSPYIEQERVRHCPCPTYATDAVVYTALFYFNFIYKSN